jgi:uncharacterized protein (TIGR03083 family)
MDAVLAGLTDEQWRTPSRCDGWTAQDVAAHLVDVNRFWHLSMTSGVQGEPTRFLAGFDPKATPAALVDAMRALSPAETYAQLTASHDELYRLVAGLDDAGWCALAEAPPGHLPVRLLGHHALWDAWVHERDILLPLGLVPIEEDDEILARLRYAAALGPGFALTSAPDARGTLVLEVTDPDARIVVSVDGTVHVHDGDDAGDVVLRGRAVDVLERLSIRAPFEQDVPAEHRWLLDGLAEVFETAR